MQKEREFWWWKRWGASLRRDEPFSKEGDTVQTRGAGWRITVSRDTKEKKDQLSAKHSRALSSQGDISPSAKRGGGEQLRKKKKKIQYGGTATGKDRKNRRRLLETYQKRGEKKENAPNGNTGKRQTNAALGKANNWENRSLTSCNRRNRG